MKQVTIHEAKTHLSRLIQQALDGEEIVIAKRNKPVVKLHPIKSGKPQRRMGWMKGKIWMSPDFDEPLEDFAEHMTTAQEHDHSSGIGAEAPGHARKISASRVRNFSPRDSASHTYEAS